MSRWKLWISVGILGAVFVLIAIFHKSNTGGQAGEANEPADDLGTSVEAGPSSSADPSEAERSTHSTEESAAQQTSASMDSVRIDRARWQQLVDELNHLREEQQDVPAVAEVPTDEPAVGVLNAEYIQEAVQEIRPLLAECYDLAREEDDALQGRLVMHFTIGGDPSVGGVVEQTTVAEQSDIRHPILDECVRETMYTIELPAPEEGGRVDVTYPFEFAPGDEE